MAKRIALFVLGLVIVLGLFFLYQHFSGSEMPPPKQRLTQTEGPTTLPMSFESRDENGVLEYEIRAAESPALAKDPEGKTIPGQYVMTKPIATFYDRSGKTVQVRADAAEVFVEQGAKGSNGLLGGRGTKPATASKPATAKSDKLLQSMVIREGKLSGHILMTINTPPSAPATSGPATVAATEKKEFKAEDLLGDGLRIYFDDELHLDGMRQVLETKGGIHVRGSRVAFDGAGLQLVFDHKGQQFGINYLSIQNGNQVIVRDVGDKALALGATDTQPASRPTGAGRSGATRPAATQIASTQTTTKPAPTALRLSFGSDVTAKVGEKSLASDKLYVIFVGGKELMQSGDSTATAPAGSQTAPATNAANVPVAIVQAPPMRNVPEKPEPIEPARPQDLVIQWSGPMEVRPADEKDVKLLDGKDLALEANGTAAKPVMVTDGKVKAQSGRLWYHKAEGRIMLEPAEFGKVLLDDPTGGNMECGAVTIDQENKKAVLMGPGTMLTKLDKSGNQTRIRWKTRLDADLVNAIDTNNTKATFGIKRAVLDGVEINSDTLNFSSNSLEVDIVNVTEDKKTTQAMEHLLASGNVKVESFHRVPNGAASVLVPSGGMTTDRMEITTEKKEGKVPVPTAMLADGHVVAWRWSDEKNNELQTNDPQHMQKETITVPRLVATLVPKPPAAPTTPATKAASRPATGPMIAAATATAPADNPLGGLHLDVDVSHFVAEGGVRIDITPAPVSRADPIMATATSLVADRVLSPDGDKTKATLSATLSAAQLAPDVQVAIGANTIQGRTILMDQKAGTFRVPGAGSFNAVLPADGKERTKPVPLAVVWREGMNYDDARHLAIFTGSPVARMLPDPAALDQADLARMTCEKTLTVQMRVPPKAATTSAPASAPAVAATKKSGNLLSDSSSLELDWIEAVGKVEAYGAQVDEMGKVLTRMRLSAADSASGPAKLHYSDADHKFVVPGPGAMVVENFQEEKKGSDVSSAGESDFVWTGGLTYDGGVGKITFTSASAREADMVNFFFFPTKGFKFSGGMMGAASAPAAGVAKQLDFVHLTTSQLVATLIKDKDAAATQASQPASQPAKKASKTVDSPIGLGAAGNQELSRVDATGTVQFDVGTYPAGQKQQRTLSYHIAGDSMTFDVPRNIATIRGKGDEPFIAEDLRKGNRISGSEIEMDMTKDKNNFHVVRPQGNISGFGQ